MTGTNFEKGYSAIEIVDEAAQTGTCGYILANPCAANLVSKASAWKGLSTYRLEYGKAFTVQRPKCGMWAEKDRPAALKKHRKTLKPKKTSESSKAKRRLKPSTLPESVQGVLNHPDMMPGLTDQALREKIRLETTERELKAAEKRRRFNKPVLRLPFGVFVWFSSGAKMSRR